MLGANAAVFLLAWVLVYARDDLWRIRALDGILEALAAGVTLGQFLVLAFYVALNARPTAGRWLHALAIIALASLGYCTIGLAFERFIE